MPQRVTEKMVVQYSIPSYYYRRLGEEAERQGRTLAGMTRQFVKQCIRELDEKADGSTG